MHLKYKKKVKCSTFDGSINNLKLPPLKIGNLTARLPLIQGGMSVRISTAPLAAAVAREGGIGVIGGSGIPPEELYEEILKAKADAEGGIVAVNIMFVAQDYAELVEASIRAKADLIITGAGFSRDIYKIGKKAGIPIASIVSSAKFARLSEKMGADAIIVEGFEAGGHLGTDRPTLEIIQEVLHVVSHTPVIAAGGISNGYEMTEYIKMGCAGVQMATRFVLSHECEASDEFKDALLRAKKEDVIVFDSPVGLPGHAVLNPYARKVLDKETGKTSCSTSCMKQCNRSFCILESLNRSQRGDVDNGILFSGSMVYKFNDILPVKTIIQNLVKEAEEVE
ncbi:NAD(P)H-dependent flavin oxidoreductase [Candidatus Margulisiibacteriota bacterium]